jgi:hypothetical protein
VQLTKCAGHDIGVFDRAKTNGDGEVELQGFEKLIMNQVWATAPAQSLRAQALQVQLAESRSPGHGTSIVIANVADMHRNAQVYSPCTIEY